MFFQINDVGHGFCAHLIHDNGNVMVWDCGHKTDPENRPSLFLPGVGVSRIDRLFIANYDEDHVSDLVNLVRRLPISVLHVNTTIGVQQLRALKLESGPLSPSMEMLLRMLESYNDTFTPRVNPPAFPGANFEVFHCSYPLDFVDSNNLSLVTFLRLSNITVLIPGDLETPAWEKLLTNQSFRHNLKLVDVFIASHHGRENGYCGEVFEYCSPRVVVMSDGPKVHATQEMTNQYASHATGMTFNGRVRRVVTTRSDGNVFWNNA